MQSFELPVLPSPDAALPACRLRGRELEPGRHVCASAWLVVGPRGVGAETCRVQCLHVDDLTVPDPPRIPPPAPAGGPGTELKALLEAAGLTAGGGCACDARAARMDAWGPAGCRKRRAEIVGWLTEEWRKLGWTARLGAGLRAVLGGLPLDPLDPAGALVDRAIERAAEKSP